MTTCRICGNEMREGDDLIVVDDHALHTDCAEAPKSSKRRQVGRWAAMGSRGQMAMGEVQRDTPV